MAPSGPRRSTGSRHTALGAKSTKSNGSSRSRVTPRRRTRHVVCVSNQGGGRAPPPLSHSLGRERQATLGAGVVGIDLERVGVGLGRLFVVAEAEVRVAE